MFNLDYPFHFDCRGRSAGTDDNDHVRDMIEQVLFTSPGERVNRPDFGSGLLQLVFAPNSPELAASLRFTLMAALQRWLSDVIEVRDLQVSAVDSTLTVTVVYALRADGTVQTQTFTRGGT
jgi:phage baseplate assembly protein W